MQALEPDADAGEVEHPQVTARVALAYDQALHVPEALPGGVAGVRGVARTEEAPRGRRRARRCARVAAPAVLILRCCTRTRTFS